MIKKAILATLVAKKGKEKELANFLKAGKIIASNEKNTITWYAFQINETTFGIFDTFKDEDGRKEHINGKIPQELAKVADHLLDRPMDLKLLDIVDSK